MVVGASRTDFITSFDKTLGHCLRIFANLYGVVVVLVGEGFAKSHGFGRNDVFERAALRARKHTRIQQRRHGAQLAFGRFDAVGVFKVVAHHDYAAAWPAQSFVGSGGYDVAIIEGVVQ